VHYVHVYAIYIGCNRGNRSPFLRAGTQTRVTPLAELKCKLKSSQSAFDKIFITAAVGGLLICERIFLLLMAKRGTDFCLLCVNCGNEMTCSQSRNF
jgi:hypothetical protein